ncbi:unnamed protein product, partial [marine sediment metagenome]
LKKENIQYSGKNFTLFSLPFYLVPRILENFPMNFSLKIK